MVGRFGNCRFYLLNYMLYSSILIFANSWEDDFFILFQTWRICLLNIKILEFSGISPVQRNKNKMGTSMTYSSKQKCRIEFRNRAIPRSKIPQHMEKYYRYKQELIKNKDNHIPKNLPVLQVTDGLGKIQLQQQPNSLHHPHFLEMPNDIPSIEDHSQLISPKSQLHEHSSSQPYSPEPEEQNKAKTENEFFPVKIQQNNSDIQTQPIPKIQKLGREAKEASVSQLPNKSKNSNQILKISKKGSSSNKKSNGRPESESSHALSQIILQREAYYTINYERFKDDIKEEGEECSIDFKDRRMSEKIQGYDNMKLKLLEKDQIKNDLISQKNEVIVCSQPAVFNSTKPLVLSQQSNSAQSKGDKKQYEAVVSSIDRTFKAKPFNIILQLNSNIDEPLFSTSLKPTIPINFSSLSKNPPTNYSNNNSQSLSTNGRARKLIYF